MPLLLARGRGLGKLIALFIQALADGDPFAWFLFVGSLALCGLLGYVAWSQKRRRRRVLEQLAADRKARPKPEKKIREPRGEPEESDKQSALRAKAPRKRPRRGFDEDEHPLL